MGHIHGKKATKPYTIYTRFLLPEKVHSEITLAWAPACIPDFFFAKRGVFRRIWAGQWRSFSSIRPLGRRFPEGTPQAWVGTFGSRRSGTNGCCFLPLVRWSVLRMVVGCTASESPTESRRTPIRRFLSFADPGKDYL